MKRILFVTLSCLILSACSSSSSEPVEQMIDTEVEEEVVLSPLEELSKVCLESALDDCKQKFIDSDLKDSPTEQKIINSYLVLLNELSKDQDVNQKIEIIKREMEVLKFSLFDTSIDANRKKGNENYAKFLEKDIYPLRKVYDTKTVAVGMDKLQLIISMGYPDKINKTTNSYGTSAQWIYRDLDVYVYLDDGIVTSFQD
jgi:PBP1b-binding outer membrane lipoprotein LpoB